MARRQDAEARALVARGKDAACHMGGLAHHRLWDALAAAVFFSYFQSASTKNFPASPTLRRRHASRGSIADTALAPSGCGSAPPGGGRLGLSRQTSLSRGRAARLVGHIALTARRESLPGHCPGQCQVGEGKRHRRGAPPEARG
eukprot:scaffold3009_cov108-Isochrysis_galbana.AAC.11